MFDPTRGPRRNCHDRGTDGLVGAKVVHSLVHNSSQSKEYELKPKELDLNGRYSTLNSPVNICNM